MPDNLRTRGVPPDVAAFVRGFLESNYAERLQGSNDTFDEFVRAIAGMQEHIGRDNKNASVAKYHPKTLVNS